MCVMLSNIDAIVLTCDLLYNHPQVVASFCPKWYRDGDNSRITPYYWGILDQPQPLKLNSRDMRCSERKEYGSYNGLLDNDWRMHICVAMVARPME